MGLNEVMCLWHSSLMGIHLCQLKRLEMGHMKMEYNMQNNLKVLEEGHVKHLLHGIVHVMYRQEI